MASNRHPTSRGLFQPLRGRAGVRMGVASGSETHFHVQFKMYAATHPRDLEFHTKAQENEKQ